jgi:endonuclease YncB( thermonuclease family)
MGVPVVLILLLVGLVYAWLSGRHGDGHLIDSSGRRVFVADGDTLRIGSETIRLAGIDAVERAQFCTDAHGIAWSCGESALKALEAVVAKGDLRCIGLSRDVYGRTVARCTVAGEGDVASAMVADGWAVTDRGGRYSTEEGMAKLTKRGIWVGAYERPELWRVRHGVKPKVVG